MAEAGDQAAEEISGLDLPSSPQAAEADAPEAAGPGLPARVLAKLVRWHPFIFLGTALGLAAFAWAVYPEPELREAPPAEGLYREGVDRLSRVLDPDRPLVAATPADEALAARNAFLNLFVFHRPNLGLYPRFINPHLLLAESNRLLAEFTPSLAEKYHADAAAAYADAGLWETRETDPAAMAAYVDANFLRGRGAYAEEGVPPQTFLEQNEDEIAARRARRNDYIRYRQAEADINLNRPELARAALEDIQREVDSRLREDLRRSLADDAPVGDLPRHAFELGPDEYRNLDLLLAKAYDGLGLPDRARSWYLRHLSGTPGGRNHAFVVERLAEISMEDGEVYRRVNAEEAARSYQAAVDYYNALAGSPSATARQRDSAVTGLARANSRLAGLVPASEATGVDELAAAGRTLRNWLEEFSGQPLPRRTLALPEAVGRTVASPEMLLPTPHALPGSVGGNLMAMAGGALATPHERRRLFLAAALENYDRAAAANAGTPEGDRAAVMAAREAWDLGLKAETEARLERMLDPLSRPDLILAARAGLAAVSLDRGDLRKTHMLILGGHAHPLALWFTPEDADWRGIAARLGNPANRAEPNAWSRIWDTIPEEGREIAGYAASGRRLDDDYVGRFLRSMNTMIRRGDFYVPANFPPNDRNSYLEYVLSRPPELLTGEDVVWRNRLLLEEAWPYDLARRAGKDNVGFAPFPPARELAPGGLVEPERVRDILAKLAAAWAAGADGAFSRPERLRMVMESVNAYRAALDDYRGDPGEILYAQARNYETLAEIRELDGRHLDALSLTAAAARSYLDVSLRARGSPREMDSLLAAGDAFFRAGLLERTVESQNRFLERFGHSSIPGSDSAMMVVRAENLLGRAHWFLRETDSALESFRRNIPRRTPDRYKSIYYIGRVMMDEGVATENAGLLGAMSDPLPDLDRNNDPLIENALQAFNHLRQSPDITPDARAWRWSTFDLARLHYIFAERARREGETRLAEAEAAAAAGAAAGANPPEETREADELRPWLALYDTARFHLTEALERYPLRRNGNGGPGISVRVEPEDYADVMASRFEAEYSLANTLLALSDGRQDDSLASLARAHLENLRDPGRYAEALFDTTLDRFQLNAAVIREEVDGGNWDRNTPLPRSRLGDDEGPTRSPEQMRNMLRNGMLLLANEYFRAGEKTGGRQLASADSGAAQDLVGEASGHYRRAYETWQGIYDRFGLDYGSQSMVGMGDALSRMGYPEDAANHYRMARNIAGMQPAADGGGQPRLNMGPDFWGNVAEERLRDMEGGYNVP